jgi:hypothetical protein
MYSGDSDFISSFKGLPIRWELFVYEHATRYNLPLKYGNVDVKHLRTDIQFNNGCIDHISITVVCVHQKLKTENQEFPIVTH